MLRAKAQKFKDRGASLRDRTLTSTDKLLSTTSIPLVDVTVNALNNTGVFRKALSAGWIFIMRRRYPNCIAKRSASGSSHCCNRKNLSLSVTRQVSCALRHLLRELQQPGGRRGFRQGVSAQRHPHRYRAERECCGMPKLELGDLDSVDALKQANIPVLAKLVDEGYDLTARFRRVSSCISRNYR